MKKNIEETLDSFDMTLELIATNVRMIASELKRMNDYNENSIERIHNTRTLNEGFKKASELLEDDFH